MYDHLTRLQKHHYQNASKLLAESFIVNPLFIYLFPNEKKREKILLNIYRGVVEIVDATVMSISHRKK